MYTYLVSTCTETERRNDLNVVLNTYAIVELIRDTIEIHTNFPHFLTKNLFIY